MNENLKRTIKINPIKYELEIIKRLAENGETNVLNIAKATRYAHSFDRYRADIRAGGISIGRLNNLKKLGIDCDTFVVSGLYQY